MCFWVYISCLWSPQVAEDEFDKQIQAFEHTWRNHTRPDKRIEAIVRLMQQRDPRIRDKLIEKLKETNEPLTARTLVDSVGRYMETPESVHAVLDALAKFNRKKSYSVVQIALQALGAVSAEALGERLDEVLPYLKHKEPEVIQWALWNCLQTKRHPKVIEAHIKAMKEFEDAMRIYLASRRKENCDGG